MPNQSIASTAAQQSALATNKVLRNTYLLLSLTILFSAGTAALAMMFQVQQPNLLVFLLGFFGLSFLTTRLRNSPWGIACAFAFTGFLGFYLGPIISLYLTTFSNGAQLVATALGGTAVIFFSLTGYTLVTRKDFSYLGGFLFIGAITAFLAGIASLVFNMPVLNIAVSAVFILISSGYIMYTTSQVIHGGETNYIMATITIYVALFNIFLSLLRLLGAFSGNRN